MLTQSYSPLQLIKYLKEVREELEKVTWPTRQQAMNKTVLVIAVSVLVGVFIGGLDLVFNWFTKLLI